MIQTLCTIALVIAALYSGGMWLWQAYVSRLGTRGDLAYLDKLEKHTFHLGLCFILSVGFLGVLVK